MSLTNCNNYINKLDELETLCNDVNTTKTQLETTYNELSTIDTNIDSDIDTMTIPSTMEHFNKFILIQIARSRKLEIQDDFRNIVEIRKKNLDNYRLTNTYEDTKAYSQETKNIENYIQSVIDGCGCMKRRKELIINYS